MQKQHKDLILNVVGAVFYPPFIPYVAQTKLKCAQLDSLADAYLGAVTINDDIATLTLSDGLVVINLKTGAFKSKNDSTNSEVYGTADKIEMSALNVSDEIIIFKDGVPDKGATDEGDTYVIVTEAKDDTSNIYVDNSGVKDLVRTVKEVVETDGSKAVTVNEVKMNFVNTHHLNAEGLYTQYLGVNYDYI